MLTACNHRFEKSTIYSWLDTGNDTCPLCRETILKSTLKPDNETRIRLGLPEKAELSTEESETVKPEDTSQSREAEIEIGEGDLSCCGMDHADKCTSCFCMCARRVESQEDDTICWNWFLGGWFARRALGSESTPGSRSAWGTLWPLWLLITAILYVVEAIIRVSILLAIIITICTVVVVALIVISIIVGILIVVAIWIAIVCIISCILCWPCYLCLCCCNCCTAILKAAAS